jgi:uridylate kinase
MIKATKVDGIYTADPMTDPTARRYDHVSYDEVIERKLQVMDTNAIVLCRDQSMPIRIINLNKPGELQRLITGENVGTLVGCT